MSKFLVINADDRLAGQKTPPNVVPFVGLIFHNLDEIKTVLVSENGPVTRVVVEFKDRMRSPITSWTYSDSCVIRSQLQP